MSLDIINTIKHRLKLTAFDLNLIKQEDLMNLHIQLWLMRNGIMRSKFLLDKGDLEVKQ